MDCFIIKTDEDSYKTMVNLLLISDLDDFSQSHYVMITDLDSLLSSEINSNRHCKHHCSNCLRMFCIGSIREEHHALCV